MRETKTVYRPLEPVIEGAEIVEVIINGELRVRQKIRRRYLYTMGAIHP
jgi:hypothetical protein